MCYVQEALYCKSRKRVSFYPVHLSLKKLIKNGNKIAISFLFLSTQKCLVVLLEKMFLLSAGILGHQKVICTIPLSLIYT